MKTRIPCLIMIMIMIMPFALPAYLLATEMTADKVIQNSLASYNRQMEGVKDITIVTDKSRVYQKRIIVGEEIIYKTRHEMAIMGKKSITIYDGVHRWYLDPFSGEVEKMKIVRDPFRLLENLKTAQIEYAGIDRVDGYKTHILIVKDMTEVLGHIALARQMAGRASGKIWVDAEDWIIRKKIIYIEGVDKEGLERTIKITTKMDNFRKENGLHIPGRTVVTTTGLVSPEKKEMIRRQLAEIKDSWHKEMPPAKRQMMKARIEMTLIAIGDAGLVTTVKQVETNTGLSSDLFDGSKL
ncbi:hypothetical protein M1N42_04945 [Thermodesulfovibrionales bacterium]|nr:hypothetical protein [Thermodesulfovibrionales bacterium]MCL0035571.1 hypothetical protein [Thermodesulfovibrionales bacterium]MCL0062527.1 hypothetical protein [Thermodesulfovibrionales bacterium]MCL0069062.1 hypothetical protein [Thermodesulfovibrionales bacterium]MCL0071426.1 hypothetical protein [Thermodesulfovibrionales bacterium]